MSVNDLTLAKNLTARVNDLCVGLETGEAPILEMVAGVTRDLLVWWFAQGHIDAREYNYHPGQRQAILNAIYAHEVLRAPLPKDLYAELAADELLASAGLTKELSAAKNAHPKYCMKMATGTGKTWVLQALLIWQYLNAKHHDRQDTGASFSTNFLIVAPGLIVYDRLLDAFLGKEHEGERNFETSDLAKYQSLFVPDTYRLEIFSFVQSAIATKEEIGRKVTGGGLIAITNWHLLAGLEEVLNEEAVVDPGQAIEPDQVVESVFPLRPGKSAGNDLNQLDQNYVRGSELQYLANLESLVVFNDEAHHIHAVKKADENTEVEWQKSLIYIAEGKGKHFVQVDFSATPYNQIGSGKSLTKAMFPHIVVDFDLKTAMRAGLVKSLVLDKRKEIASLEFDFKAERDEKGNVIGLSDGQRVMLRAGLTKLKKLEEDFARLDQNRRPKMMVMCEDTEVTPYVEEFFRAEGLSDEEFLRVDSGKKGELKKDDWDRVRERLFDVDRHPQPRVIISVLMLREGFDVNNICVIVPLRSTQAQILLEQTIGRGLRLMWRESEYADTKTENRQLIRQGKEPSSLIDVLSIIEHPAFMEFYAELMKEGLIGEMTDEAPGGGATGDLISVGLREGYEEYDIAIPFILEEEEETVSRKDIALEKLAPFDGFTLAQLKNLVGKGDKFTSHDVETGKMFGDYRVDGGVMTATGYNDYIARLVNRVSLMLTEPLTESKRSYANMTKFPYMQIEKPKLAGLADRYIRQRLFSVEFAPLEDENWRMLLLDSVATHVITQLARAIMAAEETRIEGETVVNHRYLSEVGKLSMRESFSMEVVKCIYSR
ncbi:MAG: DEAD/DEAH box helicase family protein, partial [Alphaproteobacteria bacterium]|nr:DEAD/DEAH box helicase family protein [Alphaproteobacteria bacterium]